MTVFSIKPDLIFFWVVISSFYLPLRTALFTNYFLGIMVDITSNSTFGVFGFLYLMSGLVIFLLYQLFFNEDIITRTSIAFTAVYLCHFIYGLGLCLFKDALGFWFVIFKSFGIALYTTLIVFLVFVVIDRIKTYLITKRLKEELE
jgi:rod shape-determining protein MreD